MGLSGKEKARYGIGIPLLGSSAPHRILRTRPRFAEATPFSECGVFSSLPTSSASGWSSDPAPTEYRQRPH
jgi:hypothetical protein